MNAPTLKRVVLKTSRLADLTSQKETVTQTGGAVSEWPLVNGAAAIRVVHYNRPKAITEERPT